ncbi:PREDICTED: pentatricopeptide repeat-containing protein At1g31430 [Theobroma cacao]|uniref:Pentatricopeptide repeat-containing protein At1g31430 n=1 Tax=Theobroma cacao TaxID=3641 RepID=A0AB32WXF6_THECC|nr:PREDICTED: pentatricopeptide repeat-containing protein At1g31430 [Theobroma cacao]
MITQRQLQVFHFISRHYFLSKPRLFSFHSRSPPLTKQSCIFLLKNCKSMNHLKQIQAQTFLLGLHQDGHTLNKLIAFCTDSYLGNFRHAEKVFSLIQNPSLFIYNVMIKTFVKKGSYKNAILVFGKLREQGLWPDNFTYPFVCKAIGSLGEVFEGEKIHGLVAKSGLEFDAYVINSLMDMYVQLGRIAYSKKIFDKMPERDVVTWNVLISALVRCGIFEDAVNVFGLMIKEGLVKPNEATIVSTLSACTALRRLELGNEIDRYVRKELELTTIMGNALLDMYCKCGCLDIARKVFDEMPIKNVNCWTSMVSGYVNCGLLDEARELFDRSPVRDVVLWTAMINGYVQFNRFDESMELFKEMQIQRVKPDKFVVVSLLTGCAQMGALEQGKWIHGCLNENRIVVDTIVGTALIEMHAKCGCVEEALEIFYGLSKKDTASWTSVICGLAVNGEASKALELFSQMKQTKEKPDDITFIGVLSACNHGGLVEEGCQHFDSMSKVYQIEPKLEHYACLIDLLGRAGRLAEVEKLIDDIPSQDNELVVPLYGSLLSACRTYGNVEMGERVAQRLVEIKSSDSSIHTLLANIYASADRWGDVIKVRAKMKDLGVKKVPGCSSIDVNGVNHGAIT